MLDWWTDLPAWLRITTASAVLAAGGFVFWYVSVRIGAALVGLGFILVVLGGKSQAEKKGYRF